MNEMNLSYDKEGDVLYLSFGKPMKAFSNMSDNGIITRSDQKTNEL